MTDQSRTDSSSRADTRGRPEDPPPDEGSVYADHTAVGATTADTADLNSLLVNSLQDYAVFALDRAGHILSWNAGAQRFKGYELHEIVGRHFSVFYLPQDVAAGKPEHALEVARAGGRYEDEGWRLRKDGSRFWANTVVTALRSESGELLGFAMVARDMSARRRTEEALRQSEERMRLLIQSVRDYGIFMLDPDGSVASWNEGAARIKGYTASEVIGRHFSIFYPPEDIASGVPFRALAIAREEGRVEQEGWRVRKDGTRFWASAVITALRAPDGTLVGFAKVTRDLTERRAAMERALVDARRLASEETARRAAEENARTLGVLAEQLRQQAGELERQKVSAEIANRAKADFLAAMSHELRTPLNAIGGYAEILALGLRGPLTAEQLQDIERIRRSQQHLLGIINDILNFSRLEAGKVTYDLRPVPMGEVVNEVAALMMPQSTANGLAYEYGECPEDAVALADRAKTAQILLNLLSNAMKYTRRGGRVTVTCAVTEERVTIAVRDTGRGIPSDKLDAIFDPFVQVGRNLTHPGEGAGLGLAISRDLARGMGGDLTVESAEGLGSTFTLALPRAPR